MLLDLPTLSFVLRLGGGYESQYQKRYIFFMEYTPVHIRERAPGSRDINNKVRAPFKYILYKFVSSLWIDFCYVFWNRVFIQYGLPQCAVLYIPIKSIHNITRYWAWLSSGSFILFWWRIKPLIKLFRPFLFRGFSSLVIP